MFECMEIAEYIYECIVEPSYKNPLGQMPTVLVIAEKIEKIRLVEYLLQD